MARIVQSLTQPQPLPKYDRPSPSWPLPATDVGGRTSASPTRGIAALQPGREDSTKDFSMSDMITSKWSDTAMGLIPGLEQHIENLPDIAATTSGPEYFQKSTADMIQNFSDAYGKAPIVGPLNQALIETTAPVLSAITSLPYDFYEATQRMEPGSGMKGLYDAWQAEQPWTAMKNRFIGAAQPLANRITNVGNQLGGGLYNLIHGRQMKARQQLMNQQIMNQRKQQMQETIRQAEAAKKKVTTAKGPPSITQKKKVTGPKGPPSITQKKKVTTAKGSPSITQKKKVVAKHSPHGGGPGSGGGGSKKGSPPTGTKGRNPWGRADGGLIDVPIPGRSRYI